MEKNKKASMGWIIWFTALVILLGWAIAGMIVTWDSPERNNACREIGFEEYDLWNNAKICKDSEGDYHFVELDCEQRYFPILKDDNCKAKEIKIGEVFGDLNLKEEELK